MKPGLFIHIILLVILVGSFVPAEGKSKVNIQVKSDTIISKTEKEIIEEVVEAKTPIKKEKVQYISQVTKYGFKNLFKNYTYNAAMPYSSQVNPYAENYMEDYLKSHTRFLQNLKQSSTSYFNFIDGILSQYGLPNELKYLAVIESNLKSNALSVAGARGPWQFMSYTAREYGLQVNQWADDRTDYFKSTHAAAKYLLTLYKDLNDWLLVIAAYNGGPGRVYSAIKKSGSRNFWDLQYYLPEESRNHVKKFIATHYIMEAAVKNDEKNFNYSKLSSQETAIVPKISAEEKGNVSEMEISGRYKALIISKNIEMDIKDFSRFNPEFDKMISMGATYTLRLPEEKMNAFVTKKYSILNECVQYLLRDINMDSKTVYGKKN
ncbi:MAG: lytic transglycosylase domain-containing protein [Ginsengibacter sp.]